MLKARDRSLAQRRWDFGAAMNSTKLGRLQSHRMPITRPQGKVLFALAWPLAFAITLLFEPIPQDPSFLDFAASGRGLGNSHFWNVITNFAFLWVGLVGIGKMISPGMWKNAMAETIFFLGVLLTAFGSAYFHYAPDMRTLVWDRLPMTMGFMAFYLAMIDRCFRVSLARRWLPLMVGLGLWTVLYWAQTEANGQGDLRFYAIVQFLPLLLIPIMLWCWPPRNVKPLWCMLGLYALAKVCEQFDHELATWLPWSLTGHALKHLCAAAAAGCFLLAPPKAIQSSE